MVYYVYSNVNVVILVVRKLKLVFCVSNKKDELILIIWMFRSLYLFLILVLLERWIFCIVFFFCFLR